MDSLDFGDIDDVLDEIDREIGDRPADIHALNGSADPQVVGAGFGSDLEWSDDEPDEGSGGGGEPEPLTSVAPPVARPAAVADVGMVFTARGVVAPKESLRDRLRRR